MKSMNKIKSLVVAAFASLFSVAFTLVTVTTLAACGNDNTAGTDEQPNAITAKIDAAIDSASAIWFQGEKTFTIDSKTAILPYLHVVGHHTQIVYLHALMNYR